MRNLNNDLLIHSINVSNYAVILGKELNLSDDDLNILKMGGLLHDIGKILIPETILNKTTKLNKEEFEIIKKHTIIGELLLSNDLPKKIKEMIRYHHERIDGKGYPDVLKDNEIPYFAKILSIVDAFDAMTTKRPYNQIKTLEETINELYKSSRPCLNQNGEIIQQFDAKLVDIFINCIKDNQNLSNYFNEKDVQIIKERKIKNNNKY